MEISRWPKALYSALSTSAIEMPRRLELSRSHLDIGGQALSLQVAADVGQLRLASVTLSSGGTQVLSASRSLPAG